MLVLVIRGMMPELGEEFGTDRLSLCVGFERVISTVGGALALSRDDRMLDRSQFVAWG